jgi:hypothetical protein
MVDLVMLQSVSYVAAAIGVCIAAIYYVMNINEQNKNRRVTLTNTLMQYFISEEGAKLWLELMSMKWESFDDFLGKYDDSVNPDNFMKRTRFWDTCEVLGLQYKSHLIDYDTVFAVCNVRVPLLWTKFKPIIEEFRKRGVYPKHSMVNFEYLASEMSRLIEARDPSYDGSSTYLKSPTK